MLALSVDVFNSAYIIFEYYKDFPHFTGITYAFPFLYGPIFFLYAKLISSGNSDFKLRYYLHFIPFILVVIYGIIFVYLESAEIKIALIHGRLIKPLPGINFISYMKPLHGIIYTLLTIQVVRTYNNRIRDSYSNVEKINLNWLRHLTVGLTIVWSVVVVNYVLNAVSGKDYNMDYMIYMSASVLIYTIGYLSLRQPQIFEKISDSEKKPLPGFTTKTAAGTSYQKSGLTETEAQNHLNSLLKIMETEKPYLNSELTLNELAGMLSISTHNLSEVLNTKLNQSFYDFVNRYRVNEVKRRLQEDDSEKYSLLGIAFDSGFNSKSAFNSIFKKHTGTTPSQYRNQYAEKI